MMQTMYSKHGNTTLAKALNDLTPANRSQLIQRLSQAKAGQTIRAGDIQITIGDDGETLTVAPAEPLQKAARTGTPKLSFGDALQGMYLLNGGE
jgi:hypothetical protein